ncbi:MAG: cytochrome c oxidase assembly protein [Actinomycetes bacterium]
MKNLPAWTAHPDVWLLVAVLAVGYWMTIVRIGPRYAVPGRPLVTRLQVASWSAGVLAVLVSSDWPVHDLAERSMYSVHMVQHLLITLIAVPLLLLGTPAWMARWVLAPGSRRFRTVRWWSRFLPAVIVFNVMLALTHIPALVTASLENGLLHFCVHAALLATAVLVWMPVASPLPEIPRLSWLPRMVYLFLQSVVPTVPASFMTLGSRPLYHAYIGLPHILGASTLDDQQIAGLIMKIGAGIFTWSIIATIFFKWAAAEERRQGPQVRRDLDRELSRMTGPAGPAVRGEAR